MEIVLIKSYTQKPWRSRETFQLIENSLEEKWRVHSINTQDPGMLNQFIRELRSENEEKVFVFNIAEYLDEENKSGFVPALLDEIGVPHLGSSRGTIEIGLDKAAAKRLMSENGIPTPRYFVLDDEKADFSAAVKEIGFPLIVKPVREGGHIGIRDDSIVTDQAGLKKITRRVFEEHHQPALVEEFLTGEEMREFSVGIIDGEPRLFTPIEIDYQAMEVGQKILSYETAQQDLERTKLVRAEELRDQIIDLAARTFDLIGAKDYSRVDLRMNQTGCYVLEINLMPGLGPLSFLPQAAEEIYRLGYHQLIQKLVENSIFRQLAAFK